MTFWIISDLHLGHDKCRDYCDRPAGFEDRILLNTARTCRKGDVLIVLGDVCIGHDVYWHSRLCAMCEADMWLIRGNHDSKSYSWYLSHGWSFAGESVGLKIFGKDILLSHKPVADCGYDINIHGHFHNSDHRRHEPELVAIKNDKQLLIMVEHTYMPINLRRICEEAK